MTSTLPSANTSLWAPVIDTHAHLYVDDMPLVAGATFKPGYCFEVDDYLDILDAEGVLFGVITAPSFLGSYNDYTVEILRNHRRLRGTAIVEPSIDALGLRHLADNGIVGIRYSLRRYPYVPDFSQPEYQRLLRRVRDLDLYVHILAETERLAHLVPQLDKAGVKLVIDHFGVPEPRFGENDPGQRAILTALQNGRTWIKLSAPFRSSSDVDMKKLARFYLAEAGPDQLLWGSDCPWSSYEDQFNFRDTIRWFEDWIPEHSIREQIGRSGLRLNKFM
jgi:predicted TIM-barrel fold metal-dependent hydrolase